MYENLPENIILPELELEILEFWKENDVFKESIKSRPSDRTFTFYEGPPTANGTPGIHHVISRTIKDMICRYKTMRNFRVFRKAGWDTQGLPVEVEVEKKLGIKSKADIEKFGAVEFNNACKESIFTYLKEWEEMTERIGYWIDLNDAYVTYHNEYIESVWWALKKFFENGLIYKGFKILPFCPICESPLSSHEVAQGYQDLKDPSVFVKFKITDGEYKDSDFLVWTTTPWTLPSNAALAVNPDVDYIHIKTENDEKFILAKERAEVINGEYTILKEFNGKELEHTSYARLFNFFDNEKKAFYVTLGDFVTTEDGTGIVHIAPSYGEDDYQIGLKYDLPVFKAVEKNGLFIDKAGAFKNKNFKDADLDIISELKSNGRLYKKEMFVHSYPHCWRHNVPLMYFATDSWFIRTTEYKDKMIKFNNTINWHPKTIGSGRFGKWLEENKDWALSRNRFWGTPLPIWYYKDADGNEHYECIGSIKELKDKAINFDDVYLVESEMDLHKPYIDEIKIKNKDGNEMKRVPQVIDCWFDSGSMPFAQFHYPFENDNLFEKNYPADFIAEGLDQTRGWFYSLHAIGTFLFDEVAYKNLIVNGMILDKNGKKMSKSVGNVVNPFEMIQIYGADVLRWYLIYSSPVGNSKLFNEEDLKELQNKFFDTLINTVRFFILYSNLSDFDHKKDKATNISDRPIIDKWIISRINSLKKEYLELMEDYDVTRASRILFDFTNDELSNWYIRRNRKRLRNPESESDRLSGYHTLYYVIIELLKMISPVSPFLTDKLFLTLTESDDSIHLSYIDDPSEEYIDSQLEEEMNIAQNIVYLVRSIRVKNNLRIRQPLQQILVPVLNKDDKNKILNVKDIILEEVNVKELNLLEGNSDIIVKKAKPNFKSIGPKFGKNVKMVQKIINELNNDQISEIEKNQFIETEGIRIQIEDIEVFTEEIEGWILDTKDNITVALDIKLNDELIEEGIVREFINRVQNFRRNNDFDISEKVEVYFNTSEFISNVLKKNLTYIKSETLSKKIELSNGHEYDFTKTDINGISCDIYIKKLN
ncbi:MAG TPA: isoleucine--tRNA ligase [Ignavibacteria bacterium]|nr:isoleucine--tRNA ligase [Ignavibacteria bacterium]